MTAPAPDTPAPRRVGAHIGLLAFTAFFVGLWAAVHWLNTTLDLLETPPSPVPTYKEITIPSGLSPQDIAITLSDHGLIADRDLFVRYARWRGVDDRLKYGEYRLSTGMNMEEVLDRLVAGNVLNHRFTVREGYTLKDIGRELERAGLARMDELLELAHDPAVLTRHGITAASAEGYCFPETYHVAKGVSTEHLLELMLLQYRQQTRELEAEMLEGRYGPYDILKIASIIEKEALVQSDMPLVSAVVYNRLERGMRLQCDVTIRYPLDNYGRHLTYADLRLDSPYNSYQHKGLPPTPICNPSRAAIEAALRPAKADYLYFVSMNNGAHLFTKSYDEHRAAVMKYQVMNERGTSIPSSIGYEQVLRPGTPAPPAAEVVDAETAFPDLPAAEEAVEVAALETVPDEAG